MSSDRASSKDSRINEMDEDDRMDVKNRDDSPEGISNTDDKSSDEEANAVSDTMLVENMDDDVSVQAEETERDDPSNDLSNEENDSMLGRTIDDGDGIGMQTEETERNQAEEANAISPDEVTSTQLEAHILAVEHVELSSPKFCDLVQSAAFVDKSAVIKQIMIHAKNSFLVTAPRRVGKSAVADMLRQFLTLEVTENGTPISIPLKALHCGKFDENGNPVDENGEVILDRKTREQLKKEPVQDTPNYTLFASPIPGIHNLTGKQSYLNIFQYKSIMQEHFGKYPVVFVTLKAKNTKTFSGVLNSVKSAISYTYSQHRYLLSSPVLTDTEKKMCEDWCCNKSRFNEDETREALKKLTQHLYYHFKELKCYVIVDEVDAINMSSLFTLESKETYEMVMDLITDIMDDLVKANDYVRSAFLTGISQIVTADISKLNNVESHRFLQSDEFFQYYGWTEEEVRDVLDRFEYVKNSFEGVKKFYNGYHSSSDPEMSIFCPWSVVRFLKKLKLHKYWSTSGAMSKLKHMLKHPLVKNPIVRLLYSEDDVFEINFKTSLTSDDVISLYNNLNSADELQDPSLYFSFLYEQGYFKALIKKDDEGNETAVLSIPNTEIKLALKEHLKEYFRTIGINFEVVKKCGGLFANIDFDDKSNAAETLKQICGVANRIFKSSRVHNEAEFHHIMYVVLLTVVGFECRSEMPIPNKKRPDLILFKKNSSEISGIVIELKYKKKNSYEALQMLFKKRYFKAFEPENKKYILIGMNIDNKANVTMSVLFNNRDIKQKDNILSIRS